MQSGIDASITTCLGDRLQLRRMQGGAALGRLFSYEVDLLSRDPDIEAAQLLETPMTVQVGLPGGGTRYWNGVVARFAYAGRSGEHTIYRATLRPWLWLLSRRLERRIHPSCSVPELVLGLLSQHGFQLADTAQSHELARAGAAAAREVRAPALGRRYAPREYFVQYRESAFAFISRLLEAEGIYYYFAHRADGHALVLADDGSQHTALPGYEELAFAEREHGAHGQPYQDYQHHQDCIDRWSVSHQAGREAGGEPELFEGAGQARGVEVGSLLRLTGSPRRQFNTQYLIVEARHTLDLTQPRGVCRCELRAIAARDGYRPARDTPRPSLAGPQTATVCGEPGAALRRDAGGRLELQLHWEGESATCWVPVAQPAAGAQFVPRAGQLVVVDFLEADPDRPIVIGSLLDPRSDDAGESLIAAAAQTAVAARFAKTGQSAFELFGESNELAGLRFSSSDTQVAVVEQAAELAVHKIERSELALRSAALELREVRTCLERCGIRCSSARLHILKDG